MKRKREEKVLKERFGEEFDDNFEDDDYIEMFHQVEHISWDDVDKVVKEWELVRDQKRRK